MAIEGERRFVSGSVSPLWTPAGLEGRSGVWLAVCDGYMVEPAGLVRCDDRTSPVAISALMRSSILRGGEGTGRSGLARSALRHSMRAGGWRQSR